MTCSSLLSTISTAGSCSEGTHTVAGIGRYAGQYWTLIGWPGLTWPDSGLWLVGISRGWGDTGLGDTGGHWLGVGAAVRTHQSSALTTHCSLLHYTTLSVSLYCTVCTLVKYIINVMY